MVRKLLALASLALFAVPATAADTKYTLNGENTKITFVGKKPDGKHEGGFAKVSGSVTISNNDISTLKVDVEIDMDSLFSDDAKLTAHLKNADFFDVKNHPTATFKVTKVEKGEKTATLTGELTMLGKAKTVSFPATITETADGLSVSATFQIDRTQWGMTYGKGKIEDKADLTIKVTAKK